MQKYRIEQIGDNFYPQQRFLFAWSTFTEGGFIFDPVICFDSLEEAQEFIEEKIEIEKRNKFRKIHNLKEKG
jgi:hypothetical protein